MGGKWRGFGVAVAGAPLAIMAHEMARAAMVAAVGGTPHVHFVWVAFDIPDSGPIHWTFTLTFWITLAGPLFTLLAAALAALWLRRGYSAVAWAIVLAAPLWAVLALGHALQWWQLGGVGTSRLLPDEMRMETYLGLPTGVLVATGFVLALACALYAASTLPRIRRWPIIGAAVAGTVSGALLWLLVLGPLVLP